MMGPACRISDTIGPRHRGYKCKSPGITSCTAKRHVSPPKKCSPGSLSSRGRQDTLTSSPSSNHQVGHISWRPRAGGLQRGITQATHQWTPPRERPPGTSRRREHLLQRTSCTPGGSQRPPRQSDEHRLLCKGTARLSSWNRLPSWSLSRRARRALGWPEVAAHRGGAKRWKKHGSGYRPRRSHSLSASCPSNRVQGTGHHKRPGRQTQSPGGPAPGQHTGAFSRSKQRGYTRLHEARPPISINR